MPILMAINASMPNFLEYFLCYLGDRSSTAITGDEAFQNTGVGFWFDTAGNLKIFYSFLCFQYLSFTLLFLFSGYHIPYFLLLQAENLQEALMITKQQLEDLQGNKYEVSVNSGMSWGWSHTSRNGHVNKRTVHDV